MKSTVKLVLVGLVLCFALSLTGNSLQAMGWCHKDKSEKHLQKLAKKLDLTKDQQDQIKKLMDDKKQKIEEAGKNYDEQFRTVLNDEQKKKWDEKMAKKQKKKEHKK